MIRGSRDGYSSAISIFVQARSFHVGVYLILSNQELLREFIPGFKRDLVVEPPIKV